ncbi:MAG TPA: HNH endonuclease [Chitinophagaceae bacterium]|nr:HNH endonuclease [Chitinophagaceae bacterium]
MQYCYNCEAGLTDDNRSEEHIIQNALGGRVKSGELLCNKCNPELGIAVDAAFVRQFDALTALLSLRRERNKDYIIKNVKSKTGDAYHLKDGRKPVPVKPTIEIKDKSVYVSARDKRELLHILKRLKEKHPGLDIENAEEKFQSQEYYMQEPVTIPMTIGGDDYFRGATKIAINAYLHFGGERRHIIGALRYMLGVEQEQIVRWFYPELSTEDTENEVSHTIYIKGCPATRTLQAFIMLFSCYGVLVKLSDVYDGADVELTYCYDVIQQRRIEKNIQPDLNVPSVGEPNLADHNMREVVLERMRRLMRIVDQLQAKKTVSELAEKAVRSVLSKYPKGTPITEEMFEEIANTAATKYVSFLHHLQSRGDALQE